MGNFHSTDSVDACMFPVDREAASHIIFNAYRRHAAHDVWRHIRANASVLRNIHILDDYFHAERALPWDRAGLKDDIKLLRKEELHH